MTTDPQSPDELDRLFGAYLKAQLPKRWPDAPVPTELANLRHAEPSSRSRLTLAASAAVLLGLGLYLSAGPRRVAGPNPPGPKGDLLPASTADGGKVFKAAPTGKN